MWKLKFPKNLIHILLVTGLTAVFLSGCANKDNIQPLPIPIGEALGDEQSDEPEIILQPEDFAPENLLNGIPIIGTREIKDGMYQSYLTGEWKDVDVAKRRPFAFIIPNNKAALPQYGISAASVIFEAPVEGRITRLLAIVEDYDDLDRIGPARSARDYFIYEAMGKEAIFCNWGLTVLYCGPLINSDRVDNVSNPVAGIDRGAAEAFKRVSRPGYAIEFTGYMFIDGYNDAVRRLGYDTHYSSNFTPQFTFAAHQTRAEYPDHPDARIIRPGGTESNRSGYGVSQPSFEYNEDDRLYYRFDNGGKHIDEMNNQQLTFTNVIYQYMYGEVRDPNDYLVFEMHSSGKPVKVFTNGKVIDGFWTRARDNEPARFFDQDGYEIVLNQGKTWICLIWDEYAEYAVYE
ncbi:MAG: DUF3048 domain-containing protein [Lachnospiraceae bacterium]|nr:DUF3048 domain-containing protein [Lachnospiraceae bacterium]